jgi:glutamine phosphoribosylpyrophosphate amidotransferase
VDLATLAGFQPAGLICEVLNDDGTMARVPELVKFSKEHGVKIGTIESLIRYRQEREKLVERIVDALKRVKGAYSLVALVEKRLVAVRDPHGFRPLVLGRVKDSYVVASETCALDLVEGEYIREVEPGEVVAPGTPVVTQRAPGSSRGFSCLFLSRSAAHGVS